MALFPALNPHCFFRVRTWNNTTQQNTRFGDTRLAGLDRIFVKILERAYATHPLLVHRPHSCSSLTSRQRLRMYRNTGAHTGIAAYR
jgi:hypothetical protein